MLPVGGVLSPASVAMLGAYVDIDLLTGVLLSAAIDSVAGFSLYAAETARAADASSALAAASSR